MKKHEDSDECQCGQCDSVARGKSREEAIANARALEEKALSKQGFYVHYVSGDPCSPTSLNAHTHGMEAFGHLDFQLVVPVPPQIGHSIISTFAERVKAGEKFEAGQKVSEIIRGFDVKLVEATETDRKVLRIILPDPQGHLDPENINEQYSVQYKDLEPQRPWVAYKP